MWDFHGGCAILVAPEQKSAVFGARRHERRRGEKWDLWCRVWFRSLGCIAAPLLLTGAAEACGGVGSPTPGDADVPYVGTQPTRTGPGLPMGEV